MSEAQTETVEDGGLTLGEVAEQAASEDSGLPAHNGSLLDALAAQRDELATNREVYMPIPGYEREAMTLMAKYRLLDGEELAKIGVRVQRQFTKRQFYERNIYAAIDIMIESCVGLFVEMPDGGKIQLENEGRKIIGYNEDLAEALKFTDEIDPNQQARSVVLGLFANNIVALQQHSILLGRWMGDTSTDATMDFFEAEGNP